MRLRNFLFVFLAVIICACTNDDTFSDSPIHQLTMDTDTLSLDTIFSKVPAPTKSFWIHNNSGEGIRCKHIKLGKGNQTGFRVNVDGEYISPERGYMLNDIEVRKGDSIRVFVEITSPMQGKEEPQLLEDDLVFQLESGVIQKVNIKAWSWDAIRLRDLEVTHDTLIQSTQPVIVYGGIKVDSLSTLTIGAGTTLYFHDGAGIEVYGTLKCLGTKDANVQLRGDRLDRMFDYLPYDLVSGQWRGIRLMESSYDNHLLFTDLHSSFNGIVCDSSDIDRQKLTLEYSTIHNCQGFGLKSIFSKVDIRGSQITNTLHDCVAVYGGRFTAQHCTIAQFYPFDANRGAALRFTNFYDTTPLLLHEMIVANSIITGFSDDVIMGETIDEETPYDFAFLNNILRTPEIDDEQRMINNVWELEPAETEEEQQPSVGEKHFKLISHDTQHYDFHLTAGSAAIGKAEPQLLLPHDRDGNPFTADNPEAGCYRFVPDTPENTEGGNIEQ